MEKNRKNLGLKGLVALAGVSLFGVGCERPQRESPTPKATTITLGDIKIVEDKVDNNINYFRTARRIRYAGKIGQDTFSLSGGKPNDVNIYYPANAKRIYIDGKNYEVEDLTTQSITLKPVD